MRCASCFLFTTLLSLLVHSSFAQDRCSTIKYEEIRKQKNPKKESPQQFEEWMRQKAALRKLKSGRTQETQATSVIPVVVHIIHNGEAVGAGTNLSDAQIASQIDVLNKDFQRLNTDASNTPSAFLPVAGSMDIQFVLAKQDPVGAPTSGIVRVQGTQSSWSVNDNALFKSLSYWPAEKYLNIWVVSFNDQTVGYAQFPISNLPNLSDSPDDRLTDGVVISNTAFGSGAFALDPKYNKGRTLTHETGHFFGVLHIWGDDGSQCTGSDYVDDTPNQGGSYVNQCPSGTRNSCSSDDMYMNFMDYTNDACMNMFTTGQFGRVNVVLQNSPRRVSLINSEGGVAPTPMAIDGAIKEVILPGKSLCGDAFAPKLLIQNIGTSTMSSLRVQMKVNSSIVETKDFTVNLSTLQSGEVQFTSYTPSGSSLSFNFEILLVNSVVDGKAFNNTASVTTTIPATVTLPISEAFNTLPANWTILNPDNLKGWQLISTPTNGQALHVNSYDYDNPGARDQFISPVLDLTSVPFAYLRFEKAYEYYGVGNEDRLRVVVSSMCDFKLSSTIIFDQSGLDLATTSTSTGNYFLPSATQWETILLPLDQFIGSKIQISFEAINGYGNNLFIDNILLSTEQSNDLALVSLVSPSPVSCSPTVTPSIRVTNQGTAPITDFKAQVKVNNQAAQVQSISGVNIQPGVEQVFNLNPITLQNNTNSIYISLTEPNGLTDANPNNNSFTFKRVISATSDIIPLRENFEDNFESQWIAVSQAQQELWTPKSTNEGTSMSFAAFSSNIGEESWLVSPVLDFSKVSEASVFFESAYAYNSSGEEQLQVLYSEDCGTTFQSVIFSEKGLILSTTESSSSWAPSQDSDWKQNKIILNDLAGKSNVRFAFVATAGNGNNLYLDNIEFFIDDYDDYFGDEEEKLLSEENAVPEDSYSVYGEADKNLRITFNLLDRQPVDLRIYNMAGQLILHNTLPETLNQTYYLDLGYQATGIYVVKVQYGNTVSARRIYFFN